MKRILGLKVDVDTYVGMKDGVPALLSILADAGVRATFFLSVGPDASGRALFQLFKNPRFLKKMVRTGAPRLYGFRTAMYGVFLPSPMIASSFPDLVKRIIAAGHEVQFHAWDHRRWQDDLGKRSADWIREWFEKGIAAFERLAGFRPTAFGAPAWRIDERVMAEVTRHGFRYLSCTRAAAPFIHEGTNLTEIPSDLPCFEEVDRGRAIDEILAPLRGGGIHVLPVHAEVEGGIYQSNFIELLKNVQAMDCAVSTLSEIVKRLPKEDLPERKFRMELLPGRAFPCAV
ncbi:MAG TPA: polysaccharide deacetylase family protein [Syntrophales bacterium]|nr:polysaccharide deacetylase family protein [Syntrophales bacterium]